MSVISEVINRVLKVRTMVAADLPRLLQIEKQAFGSRLLRSALPSAAPTGDRGIWVATIQNSVVGYLIYQAFTERRTAKDKRKENASPPSPPRVDILHLFVANGWRRQGIGKALIERFEPKPYGQMACVIQAAVPETDLGMQLLLRAAGYKAVRVLRGFYVEEDAYLMEKCPS
jgi:ribosomal protein S18 acetylase RimI-like enzyme